MSNAMSLKAKIRNIAKQKNIPAQVILQNYMFERLLVRLASSAYKDKFVLKGGMLVAAIVGLDNRATMDIDTTIRNFPLDCEHAKQIVEEIAATPIDDNIRFEMKDVSNVMDEAEYGGVRLSLDAFLDTTKIPLKIDISTGDVVTPAEITYHYKLMFEQRYISLWAYTLETVLAEKIETVLTRTIFNTRLRDFYDLYILQHAGMKIDTKTLAAALAATCRKRDSEKVLPEYRRILDEIEENAAMREFWESYQKKNSYATGITWETMMNAIRALCDSCIS